MTQKITAVVDHPCPCCERGVDGTYAHGELTGNTYSVYSSFGNLLTVKAHCHLSTLPEHKTVYYHIHILVQHRSYHRL